MSQKIDAETLARIGKTGKDYRESWNKLRLAAFVGAGRFLRFRDNIKDNLGLNGDRSHPDYPLQIPWLPKWPGLRGRPFFDTSEFPWTRTLEEAQPIIKRELQSVLTDGIKFVRSEFEDENEENNWRTYYFFLFGKKNQENCGRCPETTRILESLPTNHAHVCFSAFPPGGGLPPHVAHTNVNLVCHLGVMNCEGATLYSGSEERKFEEGKCIILDDSFVHSITHNGPATRYSLMITFWHPDLNAIERAAIKIALGNLLS